jgi:hypothetical protein
MRLTGLAVLSLVLVVSACGGGSGGGSSSPTEPPPPPPQTVPLEGRWSGSVTITSPNPATCTLSLDLVRDGLDYLGNWNAQCSGTQGNGLVFVTSAFFGQVLVAGLQGQPVFGGCGWASLATRDGNRLRGDWDTPQNCQTGPVLRGRMELTKQN